MAVPYYVYQDNRRNGTKLWYGRATFFGTLTLDDIAAEIQNNCSLRESDCKAINIELVEAISYELKNSSKVVLDGLGYFTPAFTSKGAVAEDKYNADEHIKNLRVNFNAKWHIEKTGNGGNGKAVRKWTQGTEFKKMPGPLWPSKKTQ